MGKSPAYRSSICGKLHLRVANIGSESATPNRPSNSSCIVYDYTNGLKTRPETINYPKRVRNIRKINTNIVIQMPDVDSELYDLLSKNYKERMKERGNCRDFNNDNDEEFIAQQRKIERVKKLKGKENILQAIGVVILITNLYI